MPAPAFSRKTRLILPLTLSVLAGGLTGFLLRSSDSAAARAAHQKITAARAAPGGGTTGKALRPRTKALVDSLWKPGTPSGQIAAALEFARLDSVDDIRDLLDHSFRFPSHSGEEVAIGTLLKRWLELEPESAVGYCRRMKPEFLARLVGTWSLTQPEKAVAWLKALPPGDDRQAAWMELCTAAAIRDPDKSWEMLARTPGLNLEHGTWQIDAAVSRMVSQDVDKAIAGMASMPPSILAAARKAIAAELMRQDPRRGWAWASQQPNPQEVIGAALSIALGGEPGQALGFMKSLPADELVKVIELSGYNWRLGNAAYFAAQLTQDTGLDPAAKQLIAARLFDRAIWSDPDQAQALLPLLSADTLSRTIPNYIQSWSRRDPAAAKAWVESLAEGPARTAAVEALEAFVPAEGTPVDRDSPASLGNDLKRGMYIGSEDPRVARLTVEQLGQLVTGVAENKTYRLQEIMKGLAASNPKTAAAWLETAAMDRKAGPAAAQFSARWAENDPAAAAGWVKTLPPGDLARTAAENVARQYHQYAPAEALIWLNSLPAGPAQEAARKVMAGP